MEHVQIDALDRKSKLAYFVVERRPVIADGALSMLRDALADASRRLTARGQPVRYLRSVSLPAEGRMLCFFEAVSADAVRVVNRNAMAPFISIQVAEKNTYPSPYAG